MARYKDTTPNATTTAIKRDRDRALIRVTALEANINAFIASVEEVTFNVDEANALPWMDNWQAQLLSGTVTR